MSLIAEKYKWEAVTEINCHSLSPLLFHALILAEEGDGLSEKKKINKGNIPWHRSCVCDTRDVDTEGGDNGVEIEMMEKKYGGIQLEKKKR